MLVADWNAAKVVYQFWGLNCSVGPERVTSELFNVQIPSTIVHFPIDRNNCTMQDTAPDLVFKSLAVYRDKGVFTFNGVERKISDVRNVEIELKAGAGCLGGRAGKINIYVDDLKQPRLSLGFFTWTGSGYREAQDNYQRIIIALNCR